MGVWSMEENILVVWNGGLTPVPPTPPYGIGFKTDPAAPSSM